MFIRHDHNATISLAYDVIDTVPVLILHLCWFGFQTVRLSLMPDFEPNEYLFNTHKDKGEEHWEIFSWAVRDAMSKASGLPITNMSLRLKTKYYKYLIGKSNEDVVAAYHAEKRD